MGMVLSFTPRTLAIDRPPRSVGAAAAVIIFPGVRYERERDQDARGAGQAPDKPGSPRKNPAAPTH